MTPRPVAPAADVHAVLAAPMRRRLLAHLEATASPLDVHELASVVGLHPSTVRFHLETLRSAGLVERSAAREGGRPDGVGRPRTAYAVARPVRKGPDYQDLARRLAAGLGDTPEAREARAERVGAEWGNELAGAAPHQEARAPAATAAARTVRLLDDLGFGPNRVDASQPGVRVELHDCPFRAVARENPEVCAVHRGLLTASLEAMGGALTGRLLPFVEPDLCMVHLETAG